MLANQTLLVTGGTGSFGNDFVRFALDECQPARIVIVSRDEKKQHDMRLKYDDPRLEFVISDVRDRDRIFRLMQGVNYVFHAAALKQVPSCEFFPMEAVRTNVLGTENVLDGAQAAGVSKVVVLSTDKAVYPINAMGQTKALMEKLVLARSREARYTTVPCGVRYGNVLYSRGSVIPLFVQQIKSGRPLTITHPDMTRLLLPLSEAVKLVAFALEHGRPGDFFVRKALTATVGDLAQATKNLFGSTSPIETIGVREGEKMHEVLLTSEEMVHADEFDEYYRVRGQRDRDYDEFFRRGVLDRRFAEEGYTSANAPRLSVKEIEQLLLTLPEIQHELASETSVKPAIRRAA